MIKDSGERREFETGAVRDIQEGKGRCDLLPLDIVGMLMGDKILELIDRFVRYGCPEDLYLAIKHFSEVSNEYCLCPETIPEAMLEVAKHYEEGCNKYGERNWEKGIPLHCYIDSAVRHYLKWRAGYNDERHDRAFIWNLLGALWTHRHKPELNDLPCKDILSVKEKYSDISAWIEGTKAKPAPEKPVADSIESLEEYLARSGK